MRKCDTEPVYTIGIAARMLDVCIETLRIWERKELIKPKRLGKNRFYSDSDIKRLEKIRELTHGKGINIEGVKSILGSKKCWEIKHCPSAAKEKCLVYKSEYNS
ncbi:MAG: MerR family transcriptional regulator [Candidatus Omnitrophica bacterium]|nr:MerR family transcriptional regulator [Candidatus Omnitrophota bacterium]